MHCIRFLKSHFFCFAVWLTLFNAPLSAQILHDSTLQTFSDKSQLLRKNGKYGILPSKKDTSKAVFLWSNILDLKTFHNMYVIDSAHYYGLMDKKTGKIISAPQWNGLDTFANDKGIVYKRVAGSGNNDGGYFLKGIIDKKGAVILPPQYFIKRLADKSFVGSKPNKTGIFIFDKTGKLTKIIDSLHIYTYPVRPQQKDAHSYTYDSSVVAFSNHTFLVEKGNDLGFLNEKLEFTPIDYYPISENHSWNPIFPYMILAKKVKNGDPYRSYEPDRFMLIHIQTGKMYLYDDVTYKEEKSNTCITIKNGLHGILSDTGVIVKNEYFYIRQLNNKNYVALNKDTALTFLTPNMKKIAEIPKVRDFSKVFEGINSFRTINYLYGICDDDGKILYPAQYLEINDFGENILILKDMDNKMSVSTKDGKTIIKPDNYWAIFPFKVADGDSERIQFFVKKDEGWAVFDNNGNNLSGFVYQDFRLYLGRMFFFKQNNLWGLAKTNNEVITALKWKNVIHSTCYQNKYDSVVYQVESSDEKIVYINENGNEVETSPCSSMGNMFRDTRRDAPPPPVEPSRN